MFQQRWWCWIYWHSSKGFGVIDAPFTHMFKTSTSVSTGSSENSTPTVVVGKDDEVGDGGRAIEK